MTGFSCAAFFSFCLRSVPAAAVAVAVVVGAVVAVTTGLSLRRVGDFVAAVVYAEEGSRRLESRFVEPARGFNGPPLACVRAYVAAMSAESGRKRTMTRPCLFWLYAGFEAGAEGADGAVEGAE